MQRRSYNGGTRPWRLDMSHIPAASSEQDGRGAVGSIPTHQGQRLAPARTTGDTSCGVVLGRFPPGSVTSCDLIVPWHRAISESLLANAARRHPQLSKLSGVVSTIVSSSLGTARLECLDDPFHDSRGFLLNLEVPCAHDLPSLRLQGVFLRAVACDVSLDLLVPVALPTAGLPLTRMTVPEGPIDEDRYAPSCKGDVDPTAGRLPIAAPSAQPGGPERATQYEFRFGVASADPRHDPPSALRRRSRGAELV